MIKYFNFYIKQTDIQNPKTLKTCQYHLYSYLIQTLGTLNQPHECLFFSEVIVKKNYKSVDLTKIAILFY